MITVKGLEYSYLGASTPAVRGLDFEIEKGEIFGFLGPSGAGKSTTQKILIGLLKEFSGTATVFGQSVALWGSDYYERIGVSFEVPNLYKKMTGAENLIYFGSLYKANIHSPQKLLEMVDLSGDGDTLVSQYSKGMRNRLNVARALLHDPEILFMDEPTAGLDPVNARRIKDLIKSQKEAGKTIFLTTHDMTVADQLCDRVAFIMDGAISVIDSPTALKQRYGKRNVRVEYVANGRPAAEDFPLEGLLDNEAFVSLYRLNHVRTIHSQEATLEDIFIEVTGRGLA